MHVSTNDLPSDKFGAVSDVSRPLLYKLNQASMSRTTYEALHQLLSWSLIKLEGGIADSLHNHEVHYKVGAQAPSAEVVPEIELPETPVDAQTPTQEGTDTSEEVKSLVAHPTVRVEDSEPLPAISAQEEAEEAAAEAEIAQAEAELVEVPAEPVPEVEAAPVVPEEVAPVTKRVAKPK